MTWWDDFVTWADATGTTGTFLGGAGLAVIGFVVTSAVALAKRAKPSLAWVPAVLRWLASLRLSTRTKRIGLARKAAVRIVEARSTALQVGIELRGRLDEAIKRGDIFADKYIDAVRERTTAQAEFEDKDLELARRKQAVQSARAQTVDAEAKLSLTATDLVTAEQKIVQLKRELAQAKTPSALPKPRPRWHIGKHKPTEGSRGQLGAWQFHLANGVAGSVARGVRVDGGESSTVIGNGYWADLSNESHATFDAKVTDSGQEYGYGFTISWYDENSEQFSQFIELEPFRQRYGLI